MGRLHPQYDFLSSSLSGSMASDPPANNRTHLRRAFIGAKARLSEQWSAQYLTDLSDAKVVTQIARAFGWTAQASLFLTGKLEGVARFSDLNTDRFGVTLHLTIRRAPASGYRYDDVSSAYLGLNAYLLGNDAKASIGYEWG